MTHAALKDRDPNKPNTEQGLFRKFDVFRTDLSDQPGGKHHGCEYFVLDLTHDPNARAALAAYAVAVNKTHPQLAADLCQRYDLSAMEGEADELLRELGLDPARFRTEGGQINAGKVRAAIKHPDEYSGLYTAPPPQQAVEVSDAAIEAAWKAGVPVEGDTGYTAFRRAVIAAIKHMAATQPQQAGGDFWHWGWLIDGVPFEGGSCCDKTAIPLFARPDKPTPPQPEAGGLTPAEIQLAAGIIEAAGDGWLAIKLKQALSTTTASRGEHG